MSNVTQALALIDEFRFADAATVFRSMLRSKQARTDVQKGMQIGRIRCLVLAGRVEEAKKELLPFLMEHPDVSASSTLLLRASIALADLKVTTARDLLRQAYQSAKGEGAADIGACMSFEALLLGLDHRYSDSARLLERAWVQRRNATASCPAELMSEILMSHSRAGHSDAAAAWFQVLTEANLERPCCKFRQFVCTANHLLATSQVAELGSYDFEAAFEFAARLQCPSFAIAALETIATFALYVEPSWATQSWWRSFALLLRRQGNTRLGRRQSWLVVSRLRALGASLSADGRLRNERLAGCAQTRANRLLACAGS